MKITFTPLHLDMVVDLSQPYDKIKFIQVNYDKEDSSKIWGAFMADLIPGVERTFEKKLLDEFEGPIYPTFSTTKLPRKEIISYYKLYDEIKKIIDYYLIEMPGFQAKINDLENHVVKQNYSLSETTAVLKSLLANAMEYKFAKTKQGGYFKFAETKAKYQSQLLYFRSIAEELKIKSNKISLLVSHGQTVGNYRETLLRDLIRKHLPTKFAIATGFIQGFSNQLDILIYDAHNFAPLFQEGDLVVVKQEAVRAVIEVKTTLTPTTLFDALEMFHTISLPGYKTTMLPIFKGVYSFESKYKNASSVARAVYDFYNKPYFHPDLQKLWTRNILYLFHQVTCVTTLNKHCVFTKHNYAGKDCTGNIIPYLYSVEDEKGMDIQTALFMSSLFEYLDVIPYAKKSANWSISNQYRGSAVMKTELKLTKDDWFPVAKSEHEHDYSQESIKYRIDTFESWFTGEMPTEKLISDQLKSAVSEQKDM